MQGGGGRPAVFNGPKETGPAVLGRGCGVAPCQAPGPPLGARARRRLSSERVSAGTAGACERLTQNVFSSGCRPESQAKPESCAHSPQSSLALELPSELHRLELAKPCISCLWASGQQRFRKRSADSRNTITDGAPQDVWAPQPAPLCLCYLGSGHAQKQADNSQKQISPS